jgi:hypothetical protein
MTDKARAHLKKVIDLLKPNVWLELDEVSFPRFFDGPLRRGSEALEAAKASQTSMVPCSSSRPILAWPSLGALTSSKMLMTRVV